jgi:aldose 1-epimerase
VTHAPQSVGRYTLDRAQLRAEVIDTGAALRDLQIRRSDGTWQRVVLGLDDPADYVEHSAHMGAIAGRFANRIRDGRFTLDGVAYQLPRNENGVTALHGGGRAGFGKRAWVCEAHTCDLIRMRLVSPAGDQGYPGTLHVTCTYLAVGGSTLRLELAATTDAPTILNLAHHSYFRLDDAADILDHRLTVDADTVAVVDALSIPTGHVMAVANSPFDFRASRMIADRRSDGERTAYDHAWILNRRRVESSGIHGLPLAYAATLSSARSNLAMDCWTTEPTLQCYDGAKLNVAVPGLDGVHYRAFAGIALEPQHLPNSPNIPGTPSTVLRPGETYRQVTEFRFRDVT